MAVGATDGTRGTLFHSDQKHSVRCNGSEALTCALRLWPAMHLTWSQVRTGTPPPLLTSQDCWWAHGLPHPSLCTLWLVG